MITARVTLSGKLKLSYNVMDLSSINLKEHWILVLKYTVLFFNCHSLKLSKCAKMLFEIIVKENILQYHFTIYNKILLELYIANSAIISLHYLLLSSAKNNDRMFSANLKKK